jgi:hypothetical protein
MKIKQIKPPIDIFLAVNIFYSPFKLVLSKNLPVHRFTGIG